MDNRPRHEELRSELARRGLPRAYIERLVAELDDHFTDLLEERSTSMGAARKLQPEADHAKTNDAERRLGEPTQLAIFAAEQYHARSFWGRHPLFTFAFMPLPLLAASVIFFAVAMTVVGQGLNWFFHDFLSLGTVEPRDYLMLQAVVLGVVCWYLMVVPPTAAALCLCRIYRRNAIHWRWPVIGCALIALVTACATFSFKIASEQTNGMFTIGFYWATSLDWFFTTWLPKFAVAMCISLLLIKRAQKQMELQA
jgi:hypothetical protein